MVFKTIYSACKELENLSIILDLKQCVEEESQIRDFRNESPIHVEVRSNISPLLLKSIVVQYYNRRNTVDLDERMAGFLKQVIAKHGIHLECLWAPISLIEDFLLIRTYTQCRHPTLSWYLKQMVTWVCMKRYYVKILTF